MPESQNQESRASILYPVIAVLLIWALFLPAIFSGTSTLAGPLEHDIGFQWIPFKEFNRWAIAQGYFPLWNPYVFAGMPFLAFSHSQALYPLGWMLTFFDYAKAVNFFYPIHLSIGFIGLYLLIRNLTVSRFSSALTGLSTVLSVKFFYFIHFLPIASSNFWGIWFFYFLVKMIKKRSAWSFLGLSLMLCLEILGGDIESTSYQLFFSPFFILIMLRGQKKIWNPIWILLALSTLFGVFLASAQFLPLEEYSAQFLRSVGFTFAGFEARTLPYQLAWNLLFPFPNQPIVCGPVAGVRFDAPFLYLGLIGIFFPIYAVFLNRKNFWLFCLAIMVALFSFGSLKPLDWITFHIPFLNKFGAQEHSFFLFQIFWAILAGLGIDIVYQKRHKHIILFFVFIIGMSIWEQIHSQMAYIYLVAIYPGSLILVSYLILRLFNRSSALKRLIPVSLFLIFLGDIYEPDSRAISGNSSNPKIDAAPMALTKAGQSGARAIEISWKGLHDTELLHHLGIRTHVGTIDGWITTPPLSYAKLLDLIEPRSVEFKDGKIDKFGFNVHFRDGKFIQAENFPIMDLLSLKYFLVNGMNLKFASPFYLSRQPWNKLVITEPGKEKEIREWSTGGIRVSGNELRAYQLYLENQDVFKTGMDIKSLKEPLFLSLVFEDKNGKHLLYSRGLTAAQPKEISFALGKYADNSGDFSIITTQLSAQRQTIYLEKPRIENPEKPIQKINKDYIEIFANREAFPEAFIVHSCRWETDPEKVLAFLKKATKYDLEKEIILFRETGSAKAVKSTGEKLKASGFDFHTMKAPVQKIADAPDRMVFKVRASYPGFLFLNHQYLPGWRAFVDGKEWPIEKADYCFRAVYVDQGEHTVEFSYQPIGFAIGLYASLASAVAFIFLSGTIFLTGSQKNKPGIELKNN